jgi:hypothetical protein
LVALTCHTAWTQLAGRRLVLNDRTGTVPWPSVHVRDLRDDHTRDPVVQDATPSDGTRDLRDSSAGEPGRRSGSPPSSVDGTTAAAALSLAAIGLGVLIQRSIVRRLRGRDQARRSVELVAPAIDDDSHEMPHQDDSHTDDEDEGSDHEVDRHIDAEDSLLTAPPPYTTAVDPAPTPGAGPEDAEDAARIVADRGDGLLHPSLSEHAASLTTTDSGLDDRPDAGNKTPNRGSEIAGSAAIRPPISTPGDLDPLPARSVVYDRREHLRVSFQSRARLQWEGHDIACETINLDLQGVRCTFPHPRARSTPPAGTAVRITLMLDGLLLPTAARVTSSVSEGDQWRVGLQFDSIDDRYQDHLLAFLDEQDRNG